MDCHTVTVALCCTNADDCYVLVLTILHSRFVNRTTECVNPMFFVPIFEFDQNLPTVSKHVPVVLLRQLHDKLRVLETFANSQFEKETATQWVAAHQTHLAGYSTEVL